MNSIAEFHVCNVYRRKMRGPLVVTLTGDIGEWAAALWLCMYLS